MVNVDDVVENEPDVNVIVAPVTDVGLVAVKFANVAVPETPFCEIVPPRVHEPAPTEAVTVAVLVVAFPY
jgi:hypothetical protein